MGGLAADGVPVAALRRMRRRPLDLQKCYVPAKTWAELSIEPGEWVSAGPYVCRAYPKPEPEGAVEAETSVRAGPAPEAGPVAVRRLPRPAPLAELRLDVEFESCEAAAASLADRRLVDALRRHALPALALADGCRVSLGGVPALRGLGVAGFSATFGPEDAGVALGAATGRTRVTIVGRTTPELAATAAEPAHGLSDISRTLIDVVEANDPTAGRLGSGPLRPTSQMLLTGPGGCGKTTLIPAVAREARCPLVRVRGQAASRSEPGRTEAELRDAFRRARLNASIAGRCIIFVDDISQLCPGRGGGGAAGRIAAQTGLLLEEARSVPGLVAIAATDDPRGLEPALRRRGRLETEVRVGAPDEARRRLILRGLVGDFGLDVPPEALDELCARVAAATPGCVGADLKAIVRRLSRRTGAPPGGRRGFELREGELRLAVAGATPASRRGPIGRVASESGPAREVAGSEGVSRALEVAALWPLRHPAAFSRMGVARPRGVLLHGPPGCGKTSLVRALARSEALRFLSASAAELYSPFAGEAERAVAELFRAARRASPCLIFIDEIDAVAGSRGGRESGTREKILGALLAEMDGVGGALDDGVIVVGATNRPDAVDAALLRPGRFDRHLAVGPPDREARRRILESIARTTPMASDADLAALAERTEGFSGADLRSVCAEAALLALSEGGAGAESVSRAHLDAAAAAARPSLAPEHLLGYPVSS